MTMFALAQDVDKDAYKNDFYKNLVASRGDKKAVAKFEANFKE